MSMLEAPAADVDAYAAAVRRALADLTPEQVDDLTDDLEVALADALADDHRATTGVGLVGLFGTPEQYAAELRAAAGLAGDPGGRRRGLPDATTRLKAWADGETAALREQSWWPSFAGFMGALAPLWWVVRAWGMYMVLFGIVFALSPRSPVAWPFIIALTVVSVQWGRGRWRSHKVARALWWIASVATVLVGLAWAGSSTSGGSPTDASYAWTPSDDVYVDGAPVANLFVYDADGEPVPNAQIYDDKGRPVTIGAPDNGGWWDDESDQWTQLVPAVSADGRQRWNVFPLRESRSSDEADEPGAGLIVDQSWPFAQAAPVLVPTVAATPAPTSGEDRAPSDEAASSAPADTDPTPPQSAPAPTGAAATP